MLDQIRLDDPMQAEVAAAITDRFFAAGPEVAACGNCSGNDSGLIKITDAELSNMKIARTQEEYKDFINMKLKIDTSEKLISLRGVRKWTRPRDLRKTFVSHKYSHLVWTLFIYHPILPETVVHSLHAFVRYRRTHQGLELCSP
jgi:hypothetical protein